MKKSLLLFISFCLICTLVACRQSDVTSDATSYLSSNNTTTSSLEADPDYTFTDTPDEKITTVGNEKFFKYLGISFNIPKEWEYTQSVGEDGSAYSFSHPMLSQKCQFTVSITGAEYLYEITQNEYLEYLCDVADEDAEIKSFTKEKFKDYDCTKIISSYTSENTQFVRIDYNNIKLSPRLYNFTIIYPAAEKESLKPIFDSLVDSIEFTDD